MKKCFFVLMASIVMLLTACGSEQAATATASYSGMEGAGDVATDSTSPVIVKSAPKEPEQANADDSQSSESTPAASAENAEIDVDLTSLSSTMIFSEVYNMMVNPEDYLGKVIKMRGQFNIYEDAQTDALYFSCIVADATACCAQGLEFVLAGNYNYPEDYPELGREITVIGTFEVYEENGSKFCRLAGATLAD